MSPLHVGYTRESRAEGFSAGISPPLPPPPYGSGPWRRSTVLGRPNPESPANRGLLAEDRTAGHSPPGRASDRRGKGGVHSREGHSRGLSAPSCCKVQPPGLGRMVPGRP